MNITDQSFEHFRCDNPMQMGIDMGNLFKIFGAFNSGSCQIMAEGAEADSVKWVFESHRESTEAKAKRNKVKEEANSDDDSDEKGSDDE